MIWNWANVKAELPPKKWEFLDVSPDKVYSGINGLDLIVIKTVHGKNNQPIGIKSSTDRLISEQMFFVIL